MRKEFHHEADCSCFGDSKEHSEICRNCTCEHSLPNRVLTLIRKQYPRFSTEGCGIGFWDWIEVIEELLEDYK